jgi:hypothetical protein
MVDILAAKSSSSEVNTNRQEKGYNGLKAETKLLDELMTRKDCSTCHKDLNTRLTELEQKLDADLLKLSATILGEFKKIQAAVTVAPVVPSDGGASFKTALITAFLTLGSTISWQLRNEQITVEPTTTEKDKLKSEARSKKKKADLALASTAKASGGEAG